MFPPTFHTNIFCFHVFSLNGVSFIFYKKLSLTDQIELIWMAQN